MPDVVINAEDLKDGDVLIGFMDRTATISRVVKGRRYVNFRNDDLGINDRFELGHEVWVRRPDEPEVERLYLVCRGCGEACDSIETANMHYANIPGSADAGVCADEGYDILPESEAM